MNPFTRVHPVGDVEEQAAIRGDRLVVPDDVLQGGDAGPVGMDPARHLGQLVRVAEKDDGSGGTAHGHDVGERQLAGLVDEQHVDGGPHVGPGEEPGGAGGHVVAARRQCRTDVATARREVDAVEVGGVVAGLAALEDADPASAVGRAVHRFRGSW